METFTRDKSLATKETERVDTFMSMEHHLKGIGKMVLSMEKGFKTVRRDYGKLVIW